MRGKMRKILTLFAAVAVAIVLFLSSASPPTLAADKSEVESVSIVIVGSPSVGLSAFAEIIRAKGLLAVIAQSDGDGIAVPGREIPIIANKHGVIPIATAAKRNNAMIEQFKIEFRYRNKYFTKQEIYDLPPEICGYSGMSFANLTRAEPV